MVEISGEKRATEFLRLRIALTIQRGHAAAFMGTVKGSRSMEEVFYILSKLAIT